MQSFQTENKDNLNAKFPEFLYLAPFLAAFLGLISGNGALVFQKNKQDKSFNR